MDQYVNAHMDRRTGITDKPCKLKHRKEKKSLFCPNRYKHADLIKQRSKLFVLESRNDFLKIKSKSYGGHQDRKTTPI